MFVPPNYKQVPIARTCCKIRFCNRFKKTRFWRARRQRGGRLSAQPTAPLCRALLSFSPFFLFFLKIWRSTSCDRAVKKHSCENIHTKPTKTVKSHLLCACLATEENTISPTRSRWCRGHAVQLLNINEAFHRSAHVKTNLLKRYRCYREHSRKLWRASCCQDLSRSVHPRLVRKIRIQHFADPI